jgi:quinol monooxygenase YgiN
VPEPLDPGIDPHEPVTALLVGRIGMVIRLQVRPGGRPALLDALHRYADDLSEEPGTEMFTISVDPDDEDLVWLYEWFADGDAQRAHQSSGAFARMATELTDVLASPPGVLRLDPLRASFQRSLIESLD